MDGWKDEWRDDASEPVGAPLRERSVVYFFVTDPGKAQERENPGRDASAGTGWVRVRGFSSAAGCVFTSLRVTSGHSNVECVSHACVCVCVLQPVFLLRYACPEGPCATVL